MGKRCDLSFEKTSILSKVISKAPDLGGILLPSTKA